ncbi:hypothetical protein WR25_07979 [Diploscapter pachys]|uniref:Tryptophan synthase beta chain-like PALP domain-containing protein n=1 Tax=Diploscapter pachys TaxID=2018661 RepID=A0A2A2KNR9_9BILA|nr:hypothetical protein WR25_07979 [Diploscapter pachys]
MTYIRRMATCSTTIIGNTPMLKLKNVVAGTKANIAVKMEYINPSGSLKDRMTSYLLERAEEAGKIRPGETVLIEPTSGNSGIALAHCAAYKGYKAILVMPASSSIERRMLVKAYGAEVVLTRAEDGLGGAVRLSEALASRIPNAFYLDQFSDSANYEAHYMTTGPEIWSQTDGEVKALLMGVGTGGTIVGIGKYLKKKNPDIMIVPIEPFESSVLSGYAAGHHFIQGIGTGFIPNILDRSILTTPIRITSAEAMQMARRLATEEGILAGIASGANVAAAIKLTQLPDYHDELIVTIISSSGERYL